MTAKGRIYAIRLSEKIQKNQEYAKKIGINYELKKSKTETARRR